ncbi:MAG: Mut7-C RNAse domain-containing protein, partial [Planctomycetes bacterium]|nr:Mut7-C RNAse domain-containing protein [Planctomycetota bacterium]
AACLLPSHDPIEQLRFVARRYGLDLLAHAFTRCPVCNEPLLEAAAAEVDVPARVRETCDRFRRCARCGRAYWEGDHVRHMRARFRGLSDV